MLLSEVFNVNAVVIEGKLMLYSSSVVQPKSIRSSINHLLIIILALVRILDVELIGPLVSLEVLLRVLQVRGINVLL
jgi:hypothetical protein